MKINDKAHFLKLLDKAILDTEQALRDSKAGLPLPAETPQYKLLLEYLRKVREYVTSGKLPSPSKRMRESVGWMLVDSWDDLNDPLASLVMDLETYYMKKL